MAGYILSVLGIVVAGIIIDIIVPSGNINKYIKSIYAIFVVAVLISPVVNLINHNNGYNFEVEDYEVNEKLLNFINSSRANEQEKELKTRLEKEGFKNVDIKINYSTNSNQYELISCTINLKNMVIDSDKQHINRYEFIRKVVKDYLNLADEVIIFYE